MMMRKFGSTSAICMSTCFALFMDCSTAIQAAPPERPTFNHTEDPRPNILPDWIYNHHVPYRLRYNRPTYHVGKAMYHVLSPTSQEALAWKENNDLGKYNGHNCPPLVKGYFYPKPWEVLNTGPRPTYSTVAMPRSVAGPAPAIDLNEKSPETELMEEPAKEVKAEVESIKVPTPK